MPSNRSRKPIDYQPRGADALFRNQANVDAELAAVEHSDDLPAEPADETSIDRATVRTGESPALPPVGMPKVRHSFDVPRQQLDALYEIQNQRRRLTGKKPTMGALLEEALADYIRKHQSTGRS